MQFTGHHDFAGLAALEEEPMFPMLARTLPKNIVSQMLTTWMNERWAPELLDYDSDTLNRVTSRWLDQKEEMFRNPPETPQEEMIFRIKLREISRIEFMLNSYHHCRLGKIKKHAFYIDANSEERSKLSPQETEFLAGYVQLKANYFETAIDKYLAPAFQLQAQREAGEPGSLVIPPNLDKGIVFRVLDNVDSFTSDDSPNAFDLPKGGVFFMRYRAIRHLFRLGQIEFV